MWDISPNFESSAGPSRGSLAPGLSRLEPGQPIAVTCPANSKAIDALLGTKGGSPRVVPDETKLAITNCASRGSATSGTFGAVQHCSLLLVLSSLFVDHPFFTVALHEPVRFSNAYSLRRSRSATQLNVGNRRASIVVTERYEGLWRSQSRPLPQWVLCHEHRRSTRRGATVLEMKEGPSDSATGSGNSREQTHSRRRR
jgi:hypothetical protein